MRWRLFIERFAPTIHCVKGEDNVVADAFSRLPFEEHDDLDDDDLYNMVEECMEMSRFWKLNRQPITYDEIAREQLKDKGMKYLWDKAPHLLGEVFEDIGKRSGADKVTTVKDPVTGQTRIAVPAKLTHRLISWCHNVLVHPGTERLYNTLRQHYT